MDKIDHYYKYSTNKSYRFYYDKYINITQKTTIGEVKSMLAFSEELVETEAIRQKIKEIIDWRE